VQKFLTDGDCFFSHYENLCWKLQTWQRELNFQIISFNGSRSLYLILPYPHVTMKCTFSHHITLHNGNASVPNSDFRPYNKYHEGFAVLSHFRRKSRILEIFSNTTRHFHCNFRLDLALTTLFRKTLRSCLYWRIIVSGSWLEYGTMWNVHIWNTTTTGYVNKNGNQHLGS
jgi:hypothetical protein